MSPQPTFHYYTAGNGISNLFRISFWRTKQAGAGLYSRPLENGKKTPEFVALSLGTAMRPWLHDVLRRQRNTASVLARRVCRIYSIRRSVTLGGYLPNGCSHTAAAIATVVGPPGTAATNPAIWK